MWDMLLVGSRILQFAGALVFMGASLFQLYGLQSAAVPLSPDDRRQWQHRVLVTSAVIAAAGTLLWIMAETVLFSGDTADATNPSAVWLVFSETRFGRVCLLRIGLLLAAVTLSRLMTQSKPYWAVQSALGAGVLATFAWTGHGATTEGWVGVLHAGADILHLWFAGVWFGALVPLAVMIARAHRTRAVTDARGAQFALDRFSRIGTTVVVALALTGLINSWFLIGIGNLPIAVSTGYGQVLVVKLGLFGLMLLIAVANRYWLSPRLRENLRRRPIGPDFSMSALRISLSAEVAVATLLLVAVGVLGTLPPPAAGV